MRYAKLGRTGLDCSRLGFGTWQVGGGRWKGMEGNESIALLRSGVEFGINIFDAAIVYGQYRGELNERRSRSLELLGEAFKGERRREVIICLKLGQVDEYSHRAIYQPRSMVDEFHRALRELKTDHVDICLIHAPSLAEVRDGRALAVVQTMQAMGAARFIGYSFEAEPEHGRVAVTQDIDVVMFQYNLLDTECAEIFALANERGIGTLVGGPFKRGYLSGQFERVEELPREDNYWEWNLRYSPDKVKAVLAKVSQLKKEAGGARGLRKQGLRQILQHAGAQCAVVGHRTKEEIADNVKALDEIFENSPST
jgi:aryl-alcohol dehydrogenase-like predicted oxidoreductase